MTCWLPESFPNQLLAGATTMAMFLAEAFPPPKSFISTQLDLWPRAEATWETH